MKTTFALASLFLAAASSVMGAPTDPHYPPHNGGGGGSNTTPYDPCSGLYDSAQCCATDILGVANLDCAGPGATLTSSANFAAVCAAKGQRARCCVIPILGQAVLCQAPAGL
ncbi:Cerato-ulmin hydrophobin family [Microdochium bolleyi]|uniref:Cerato-ulmin hydrophobin family n=1 Tax=Microdochium bolleyi TaxID=196109 RepID=A0A136IRA7_9PEZI|nr:Cerato-ulmin hydrophobin family [Microdochium bolleyi]